MRNSTPVKLPPYRIETTFSAQSLAEVTDWGLAAYAIPQHWRNTAGQGVRVAVLDTGIQLDHPDLADAIESSRDFTSNRNGAIDRNGHGTHAAGIIAARQNGRGVVGVAPLCRLLIGKVLDDSGQGSSEAVAAGIDWACKQGVDIINLSLGSDQPDSTLLAAIRRAIAEGRWVIAAAGNDGGANAGASRVNYPARWSETIAVAAVDRNGRLSQFSSQGPEVDIAAPGQDVLSTFINSGYAKLSGTSMAAPFVAGVAALLLSLHRLASDARTPLNDIQALREHLLRTAQDAGPTGHDPGYGWGLINPTQLLIEPLPTTPPQTEPPPHQPGNPQDRIPPVVIGNITLNDQPGVLVFEPR
ncbi:MAG: S8 family peptidase [Planctomycetota bacterium]|nr:S8 family peptidase [Planctomycetota bacterium]